MGVKAKPAQKAPKAKEATRLERALIVVGLMKEGQSMRQACRTSGVSMSAFMEWVAADQVIAEHYARGRAALLEHWAEDIMDIGDEPVPSTAAGSLDSAAVAKQRLQVDTRKWLLSKLAPKKYGDVTKVEHSGTVGLSQVLGELDGLSSGLPGA